MGLNPLVNASSGANGASSKDILVSCEFCLKSFQPYRRSQRFCGARCRLLKSNLSRVSCIQDSSVAEVAIGGWRLNMPMIAIKEPGDTCPACSNGANHRRLKSSGRKAEPC